MVKDNDYHDDEEAEEEEDDEGDDDDDDDDDVTFSWQMCTAYSRMRTHCTIQCLVVKLRIHRVGTDFTISLNEFPRLQGIVSTLIRNIEASSNVPWCLAWSIASIITLMKIYFTASYLSCLLLAIFR